jgi:hypothetical protein
VPRNDEGCYCGCAREINDVFQNKNPGIAAGVLHFVEERPLRFRIDRSLAVDNNRTTVVVSISVVITLPNDNRLVVISAVPIPSVVTVTVTVAITGNFTHRYAARTYSDSDLLRSGGNCAKNTHRDSHHYCVSDHCCSY